MEGDPVRTHPFGLQGLAPDSRPVPPPRICCLSQLPHSAGLMERDKDGQRDSLVLHAERARDYLHKTGRFIVIGGIVSPVHDSYGKQIIMIPDCQGSLSFPFPHCRVDPWECYQDTWQTTCSVLEHHRDLMKRVTGCILSNVNTPSLTPVIGQPQNESPQPIYQNSNLSNKPTAAKFLGKVGESLSRICCVRPPMERFTFVDENANLGTVMRYEEIELRILLLCGSDLLESFCIPGLWNEADVSCYRNMGEAVLFS
ncbi:nicotinamide/nicotinic acid mononucleotide adenylyltransferase 2-like [Lacerta agilis]|uniref:nicotinamide/nicotinic acid mononucleotide adenylyltransferase 2-like n=1 Tax=Lacerta agilis TaxID=80427 RepID=UPI00141A34E1|nr:nicotinamide/nicotinic acid mononucleotide adenylyltransferase 2-like [Lacerta agilis]